MKATIEQDYYCSKCKHVLEQVGETLVHPKRIRHGHGVLVRWHSYETVKCPFAGKTFKVPTFELEVV